ncbi:MAG: tyrosine-type recombinase/integrase [Candidatus Bathyarchaeales archaeon]
MKRNAYAESTIEATGKRLKHLSKYCSLDNPELVKDFISKKNCSNGFKESLIEAYAIYCKANNLSWNKPFYERYDKLPKIPSEEKLNMIIANCSKRLALILSIIKDLGLRPIEVTWLKVKDVDMDSGVVTVTSAKHCMGRTLKLKPQTLAILKNYVVMKKLSVNDRLFPVKSSSISESYRIVRNRVANKFQDSTIKTIRLYDFRHFRASMEYYRTKDLLYVKSLLGHKDLRTTLRYTQLISFGNDEYSCAVAKNVDDAKMLIESGFDYVTDIDGVKLFRKRK